MFDVLIRMRVFVHSFEHFTASTDSQWLFVHRRFTFVDEGENFVSHGELALILRDDVRITKRDLKLRVASFEYLCGYVTAENRHVLILGVYRLGSVAATSEFFKDLTAVFP